MSAPSADDRSHHWTDQRERYLRSLQQQCRVSSYGHSLANEYYDNLNDTYLKASIIMTSLAVVCQALALAFNSILVLQIIMNVGSVLLTGTVTGLTFWIQGAKPTETAMAHAEIVGGYQAVIISIDQELANEVADREYGPKFVGEINDKVKQLRTGATRVPERIMQVIRNQFARGELDFDRLALMRRATIIGHGSTTPTSVSMVSHSPTIAGPPSTISAPPSPDSCITLDASSAPIDVSGALAVSIDTSVGVSDPTVPAFELRFGTDAVDPIEQAIAERLFKFHLNRFNM